MNAAGTLIPPISAARREMEVGARVEPRADHHHPRVPLRGALLLNELVDDPVPGGVARVGALEALEALPDAPGLFIHEP
ncbi:MAG TPA: hypothetical protein VD972_45060 [Hyalangium sp.]|nr:hypothetical protein [Hyalangium sp.]HYI03189.1 hypothetical protein [Hyalangium sp.]